jgi:hypothetical protein
MSKAMEALDAINEHKCGCNNQGCGYALNDEHIDTLRDYITTTEARIKELEERDKDVYDIARNAEMWWRLPNELRTIAAIEPTKRAVLDYLDGARKVEP